MHWLQKILFLSFPAKTPMVMVLFSPVSAGGSSLPQSDFNGAAPDSMLAVVKLKEAKQYLKSLFFFLPPEICLPIKVQIL